jgi:hypothetical protein
MTEEGKDPAKPIRKPGGWKGGIEYLTSWEESDKAIAALFEVSLKRPPDPALRKTSSKRDR